MRRWTELFLLVSAIAAHSTGCDSAPATIASPGVQPQSAPETLTQSGAIVDKSFDDIKFEMELDDKFQKTMITPEIKQLFGQRIRIRGYIYPTLKKKGLKQFVLVRDNLECCFGPGAALFDCILVHMEEGRTAEFSIRPVAVEGKFSFEEFLDYDGTTRAIYRLDGEAVE
ncbi:MAG: DUF3299 domain-containing protein [Bythopirellula sp.]